MGDGFPRRHREGLVKETLNSTPVFFHTKELGAPMIPRPENPILEESSASSCMNMVSSSRVWITGDVLACCGHSSRLPAPRSGCSNPA